MDISFLVLFISFVLLLLLSTPIAIAIAVSTMLAMLFTMGPDIALTTIAQRMATGLDSFALLAIPFFILSGYLMGQGGIAKRLINFAMVLVGRLPGGLAFVNVISCALFGSISGSAVAATSAIGGFMIPAMNKEGYDKNFNTAVTVTASTTGMLIPPSNILIIFSLASGGVSIAALFMAGYLPGILMAAGLLLVCAAYSTKNNFPRGKSYTIRESFGYLVAAIPSLLLILIVIGGIISGIFTPTEAGAIAVAYALLLSLFAYREITVKDLPDILLRSVQTTAIVMLLIGASAAMSWMLSYEFIPQRFTQFILALSENPLLLLLLINLMLLLVGTFLDMTPAVLIFTPILLPVMAELGVSPLHFGIMMIMNLSIGLCTPPVGGVLFVGCSIGKTTITAVIKPLIPLYIAMFVCVLIVTFVPQISEWLPRMFGLIK
ncbi:TRAP transporter large permease [Glaciecola sp. 1036]|uniref:TRAP transporter large permease n=1 Tax=Alteromonadaceae TaxID=72275 RepID=UPI003D04ADA1